MEYLVVLVNDNLLDPADIMSSDDLRRVLERGFVQPPPKNRMNDGQYEQLLLQVSGSLSFDKIKGTFFGTYSVYSEKGNTPKNPGNEKYPNGQSKRIKFFLMFLEEYVQLTEVPC